MILTTKKIIHNTMTKLHNYYNVNSMYKFSYLVYVTHNPLCVELIFFAILLVKHLKYNYIINFF